MDPNQTQNQNPTNSGPANVPPVAPPPAPPVNPIMPAPNDPPSQQNGKMIFLIVLGTILLISLGIIYFMAMQMNNSKQTPTPTPIPTQALPTLTPTPTPLTEDDIDTIDLGSPDTDLKTIDEDLKQL